MSLFPAGSLAFSYLRFSTPDQAVGDSLRRQLASATAYAAEHGLVLDTALRDLGVSAFGGANRLTGALGRFLSAVEEGRVPRGSVLIVESLDRLSRQDVLSAQEQLLGLIRSGIVIVTLTDRQVYSRASIENDWTRLMLSIVYMARAHEESATKALRVAAAWSAKRKRATDSGEAQTSRCVAWCTLEGSPRGGARHVLIPDRVAVLRRIYEMTAAGLGQRMVAKRLNEEGIPAWGRGDGWQVSYVSKLLETRAVLGFFQPHTKPRGDVRRQPEGPEIAGYYPAAIDEELYYAALAARSGRRGKGGPKGKGHANLFSNLGKCASCGRSMVHLNKGDTTKGGKYLMCDSTVRGLPCEEPARWRYERAEAAILSGVRRLNVAAVLGQADPAAAARARADTLASQLSAEERKRERLLDALGDLEDAGVIARVRASAESVARLRAEHAEAEKAAGLAGVPGSRLSDRVAMVGELTDRLASAEGQDLTDLRALLAQELRKTLIRLRFTPWTILADYRFDGVRKGSPHNWTVGVPLIQSPEDAEEYAAAAEADAAMEGQRQFGRRRRPLGMPPETL